MTSLKDIENLQYCDVFINEWVGLYFFFAEFKKPNKMWLTGEKFGGICIYEI